MAVIRPFRALRPAPDRDKEIASVPYDVVSTEEAKTLAEGNPLSFLHVIRPEIDLPDGTDLYTDEVYEKARENFNKLIDDGNLITEDSPAVYAYRLVMGQHEQTGIACCCSVSEYNSDIIKKHEYTRKEKEDDRLRHMLTLKAHAGPVLMTYRGRKEIDEIIEKEVQKKPLYDFEADDGIRHAIWRITNDEALINAFKAVPSLYIADGHHRAAGAGRVKQEMEKSLGKAGENEEWCFFLAVLFPSSELVILPYNRWISDLGKYNEEGFLEKLKEEFELGKVGNPVSKEKGIFHMYLGGSWYELRSKANQNLTDPVGSLDLSLFQRSILEPLLGIEDQRKDKRIDFVGGEKSTAKLERLVDEKGGVAFSFYPVGIEELLAVSDAGLVMPPKSTWFVPKLRSGLLIHQF
ncbi:MAG: DUF1015 domain-containing protein [Spirochaetota bacterium]|nr:MAG: DUF1015 domain-containing protein [Spirochaetota bacterium]